MFLQFVNLYHSQVYTTMKLGATLSVVSALTAFVAATPLDWENKRALPAPVSVATAKTYLAACKDSI
jgi:hypothetical protein